MTKKNEKTPEEEFLEAIMIGDNLAGMKAQRKMIATLLVKGDLESDEQSRMHRDVISITKEIIKLEGSKEEQSESDLAESEELAEFQKEFKGE